MFDFDHLDKYVYVPPFTYGNRVPAIIVGNDKENALKVAKHLNELGYHGCYSYDEYGDNSSVITVREFDTIFGFEKSIYFGSLDWCQNRQHSYILVQPEDVFRKIVPDILSDIDSCI